MKSSTLMYTLSVTILMALTMVSRSAQADLPFPVIPPIDPLQVFNNPDPSQLGIYDAAKVQQAINDAQAAKAAADLAKARALSAKLNADLVAKAQRAAADAAAKRTACQNLMNGLKNLVRTPFITTGFLLDAYTGQCGEI